MFLRWEKSREPERRCEPVRGGTCWWRCCFCPLCWTCTAWACYGHSKNLIRCTPLLYGIGGSDAVWALMTAFTSTSLCRVPSPQSKVCCQSSCVRHYACHRLDSVSTHIVTTVYIKLHRRIVDLTHWGWVHWFAPLLGLVLIENLVLQVYGIFLMLMKTTFFSTTSNKSCMGWMSRG